MENVLKRIQSQIILITGMHKCGKHVSRIVWSIGMCSAKEYILMAQKPLFRIAIVMLVLNRVILNLAAVEVIKLVKMELV
jgi:hypothetical protein